MRVDKIGDLVERKTKGMKVKTEKGINNEGTEAMMTRREDLRST